MDILQPVFNKFRPIKCWVIGFGPLNLVAVRFEKCSPDFLIGLYPDNA